MKLNKREEGRGEGAEGLRGVVQRVGVVILPWRSNGRATRSTTIPSTALVPTTKRSRFTTSSTNITFTTMTATEKSTMTTTTTTTMNTQQHQCPSIQTGQHAPSAPHLHPHTHPSNDPLSKVSWPNNVSRHRVARPDSLLYSSHHPSRFYTHR